MEGISDAEMQNLVGDLLSLKHAQYVLVTREKDWQLRRLQAIKKMQDLKKEERLLYKGLL